MLTACPATFSRWWSGNSWAFPRRRLVSVLLQLSAQEIRDLHRFSSFPRPSQSWSDTYPRKTIFNLFYLTSHIKLIAKVLQHTKKMLLYFLLIWQKISIIWIHSHWMAIVVLAVVVVKFDNLREKRWVHLSQ